MTIILALGNSQQIIQISDRRLSGNGRTIDDESNKAGVLACPNARLSFGFTGLAKYGNFNTMDWLLGLISDAGPPNFQIYDILERLRVAASESFFNHPALRNLARHDKKLSVMFSGYLYNTGVPVQAYALISNYVDWQSGWAFDVVQEEFNSRYFSATPGVEDPLFIQRIGNWSGIRDADIEKFRSFLAKKRPAQAVVGYALSYLRELADHPGSSGTIGKQFTSIIIPQNPNADLEGSYHSNVVRREFYMPASVSLFPDQHWSIANVMIRPVEADTPPMSFPTVNKNAPCPCGSRIRYKNCHGKIR
jgi:hypothetical protein